MYQATYHPSALVTDDITSLALAAWVVLEHPKCGIRSLTLKGGGVKRRSVKRYYCYVARA